MHAASIVVLREAGPDDDAALIAWFPDAAALRRFAGDSLAWPLTPAQLDALRADPRNRAFTAWSTGPGARRVGHAELVDLGEGRRLVARFGVAPAVRGRGVGAALLRALIERARSLGAARVELNVFADNRDAVRLYRSAGFEEQAPDGARPEVLRMARDLG